MQKIKNLIRFLLSYTYFPFLVPLAKKRIRNFLKNNPNINDSVKWVSNFYIGPGVRGLNINFKAGQIESEITPLLSLLEKENPRRILEIGTASGGTLFLFSRVLCQEGEITSIDLPFGKYGAGYLKSHMPLFKEFINPNQEMHLIRKDSHKDETIESFKEILKNNQLDFLFIDGDHTYKGVSSDFEKYKNFVKPGGIIALHDIVENHLDTSMEVWKFWNDIKNDYKHEEFIDNLNNKYGCGIGVIYNH